MFNTYKTTKNSLFALTIVALVLVFSPSVAKAGSYGSGLDSWSSGDSYSFSPVYDSYTPAYDSYSFSPVYDSYFPSYSGYSNYSSPSYGGYSYSPQPSYSYIPYSSGSGGGSQYVYSSNTNNNTNANTNTISNTFNPVNNNDAKINLIVYGGGGSNTNTDQSLNGSCTINPTTGYINQDVTFSASATGGNGSYSYSWTGDNGMYSSAQNFTGRYSYGGYKTATVTITSGGQSITRSCGVTIQDSYNNNTSAYCVANPSNAGINQNVTWTVYPSNTNGAYYNNYSYSWTGTDNLYGSGQTITRSYNTPGYKTATVTMYGNGQTITTTCNTNIGGVLGGQSNVTVIRDQNLGTPVSGVFLSQVPDTGISFGLKMTLFGVGLILWSIFAAYMIARRKGSKATFVEFTESSFGNISDKVTAFKLANMQKKGIQG